MDEVILPFSDDQKFHSKNLPKLSDIGKYSQSPEELIKLDYLSSKNQANEEIARDLSVAICEGFLHHDLENRNEALKCFAYVDSNQLQLKDKIVLKAARNYQQALDLKDNIELENSNDVEKASEIDPCDLYRKALYKDRR